MPRPQHSDFRTETHFGFGKSQVEVASFSLLPFNPLKYIVSTFFKSLDGLESIFINPSSPVVGRWLGRRNSGVRPESEVSCLAEVLVMCACVSESYKERDGGIL